MSYGYPKDHQSTNNELFNNNEETIAEYIEARRQVKRIVKQQKHSKEY